jgi:hypothetical protein
MNVPRYSAAAAKLLARHVSGEVPRPGERDRGIATIERAMRQRTRRRWLLRSGWLLGAAAALAMLWQVSRSKDSQGAAVAKANASPLGRGATVRDRAGERPLDTGAELRPDQAIETADGGGASLRLSTGTRVELAGRTSLHVESRGKAERFALARGELSAQVAKLAPGERFVVETPDAEIEVRGTMFRLAVLSAGAACGAGSRTRLDVSEGVVEVRSAGRFARVAGGEHWPPDCPSRAPAAAPDPQPEKPETQQHAGAAPGIRTAEGATGIAPHATLPGSAAPSARADAALKRQNDRFGEAIALAQRGDTAGALRAHEELRRSFPGSPLAENALVERMRLLLPAAPERAREEARRYLLQYPHGFAVEEAKRVLGRP